jgi:hypothetical protein
MPWWVKDYADGWIEYATRAEAWDSQEARNGALVVQGPERPVQVPMGEDYPGRSAYVMPGEPPWLIPTRDPTGPCPFCFVTDPEVRKICARCIERDSVQAQIAALTERVAKLEGWHDRLEAGAKAMLGESKYPPPPMPRPARR